MAEKRILAFERPDLLQEWDYDKNSLICAPDEITTGSNKKVWWKCRNCGYEWEASINHRVNNRGCPFCSGKALWKGHNDLETVFPKIAKEWNYTKNGKTPSDYQYGSSKKVWWQCSGCGYEWEMSIATRTSGGQGCPYCGHNAVWVGHNDLRTINPELCEEWNYEKNDVLRPEQFSAGSHKKVWWKCKKCGFEWEAVIKDRAKRSCPHCAGKTVWEGHNDIATTDSWILEEWDFEKNGFSPTEFSRGSGKKVWWKCKTCHGIWEETINNRVINKYGCPFCSGKRVLKGYNDLATKYPFIAEEWDYSKNKIIPYEITSKSSKKVWWICSVCGNNYSALISDRTNGSGCPRCSKDSRTSFPEQVIYYYIKLAYVQAKNGYKPKWLHGKEIDIFIPEINVAIEYDGAYWHTEIHKDLDKNELIKKHHIKLFRVREQNTAPIDDGTEVIVADENKSDGSHIVNALDCLFTRLKQIDNTLIIPQIDIGRDRNKIINQYAVSKKSKSLEAKQPQLAEEWDSEKNGILLPHQIAAGSNNKVWWKCNKCGNSWEATPKDRVNGSGCPFCTGRKIAPGYNDLETAKPDIAAEWDYAKNDLSPSEVGVSDLREFWWKCSRCGKSWKTSVAARRNKFCPDCNYYLTAKERHLIVGKTDFASIHPELLEEWMYEKNTWTDPTRETAQSHVKVWWKCSICGTEWMSTIGDRSSGHGCPECAKQKRTMRKKQPIKGESFGDLFPELIEEWDSIKNEGKTPFDYRPYSSKRVWWVCKKCGREWATSLSNRAKGAGCRNCAHKKQK